MIMMAANDTHVAGGRLVCAGAPPASPIARCTPALRIANGSIIGTL
jgi:hypothetical protein